MALHPTADDGRQWYRAGLHFVYWFVVLAATTNASASEEPQVPFDDPFLQVTGAIAACAPRAKSSVTQEQMRVEAHSRAERGTSCYQSGRCRLPNSYTYDKEIIPRVR